MADSKKIHDAEDSDYIAVAATLRGAKGQQGIPLLGWGPPGAGKSSLIEATLKGLGYEVMAIDLGVYEPSDVVGIPRVSEARAVEFKLHPKLEKAYNDGKKGWAIILDDISHAPPAVQAAAMRLVLEREAAMFDFRHVPVFGTANPIGKGGMYELNQAFGNRWLQYMMKSDNARRYEQGVDLSPKVDRDDLEARIDAAIPMAKAMTNEFQRKAGHEHVEADPPEVVDNPEQYAYPTGRTWSVATKVIAGCEAAGISPLRMVKAAVGEGAASAYAAFVADIGLPSPEEVLAPDSKVNWQLLADQRPDAAAMAMEACAWAIRNADELRGFLRAAMKIRDAKHNDLPAHSLRLVRGRTQKPDDILYSQLTNEVTEELVETMQGLGLI